MFTILEQKKMNLDKVLEFLEKKDRKNKLQPKTDLKLIQNKIVKFIKKLKGMGLMTDSAGKNKKTKKNK